MHLFFVYADVDADACEDFFSCEWIYYTIMRFCLAFCGVRDFRFVSIRVCVYLELRTTCVSELKILICDACILYV